MRALLILFCLAPLFSYSQEWEIGSGTTFDFNVGIPNLRNYAPVNATKTSTFGFDFYIGVPVGRFMLYPTFIYAMPVEVVSMQNHNGQYVPLGQYQSLPFKPAGQGWEPTIYSKDYVYDHSDLEISQKSFGSYATFVITEGVEVGAGLFFRDRKMDITDYTAYDEYAWYNSTDSTYDNYAYQTTWINPESSKTTYHYRSINIPLTLNFKFDTGPVYSGLTLSYWLPGDGYFSIRYTAAIRFE